MEFYTDWEKMVGVASELLKSLLEISIEPRLDGHVYIWDSIACLQSDRHPSFTLGKVNISQYGDDFGKWLLLMTLLNKFLSTIWLTELPLNYGMSAKRM